MFISGSIGAGELAAKAIQQQLSDTQRGERYGIKDKDGYYVGFTGVKRQTSDSIAYLLDSGRFSYESIGKALDDIIHNNGQENYAAAKRVELVLDDMLTNGYADVDGRPHGPNEAYIAEKAKIPGAEVTEAAQQPDGDYFADLVEDGFDTAQEQAQQRTAQDDAAAWNNAPHSEYSREYDRAGETALRNVANAIRSGKSSAELLRLSAEAKKKYYEIQASLPREVSYTDAQTLELHRLELEEGYYESASRNPQGVLAEIDSVLGEAAQAAQETEAERRKRESYKDVPGLRWKSVAPARVDELLRTGLAELDGQRGVGNDGEVPDAWQYSISEDYESEYDRWIADGKKPQKPLYVGTTSEALKSIGAKDAKIYWNTTKINSIQKNHPFMTDGVMKQVPQILENPILIMESKTQPNRVTMYGEVYAENGIPVMAVLELAPRSNKGYELQNMVIANAYNKGADVKNASIDATQRLIDSSDILYVDPDKKRTDNWLSLNRLQLPLGITSYGPIHNITLVARDSQGNFSADTKNSDLPEWKKSLQEYSEQQFSVSEDSQGRELSEAQQAYFRDSAVRDEDGRLMVMYHGTNVDKQFAVFDTYGGKFGLFGNGSYFTDNRSVAESYTKKEKGTTPRVYETYLNIQNPLDMDAPFDLSAWDVTDAELKDYLRSAKTNEEMFRQLKEYCADNEMRQWEAEEFIRDFIQYTGGYDGITHIGGGRYGAKDGPQHQVYIAFEAEQIKNVTNQNPTRDPDIRYSVSEGKTQDELLNFVTQFQRATEERFREVPKETTKETVEDNAAAIRGDLEQLAELARQSEEAQGIQRQTPEEIAESKVNARVGDAPHIKPPRRLTKRKLPGSVFSRLKFQVPAELNRVIPEAADAAVGVADVRLAADAPAYGITEAACVEALSCFPALLAELALRVVCRLAERLKILQPLGRKRHDAHVVFPAVFVVDLRLGGAENDAASVAQRLADVGADALDADGAAALAITGEADAVDAAAGREGTVLFDDVAFCELRVSAEEGAAVFELQRGVFSRKLAAVHPAADTARVRLCELQKERALGAGGENRRLPRGRIALKRDVVFLQTVEILDRPVALVAAVFVRVRLEAAVIAGEHVVAAVAFHDAADGFERHKPLVIVAEENIVKLRVLHERVEGALHGAGGAEVAALVGIVAQPGLAVELRRVVARDGL